MEHAYAVPPHAPAQGAPKKKKKTGGTYLPTFFEIFLRFSGLILENIFMVFLSSSCRETAKNAINKNFDGERRKDFFPLNFFGQTFLT
jgi:hypothetical protein